MARITSLSDLLMEELASLLNAENQWAGVMPKMAQASQSMALKIALENYLEITIEHIERLQGIFRDVGQNSQGSIYEDMKGSITESEDVANRTEKSSARDAVIISMVERVEQYEITGYQTAREHAADLGHIGIVALLSETLNEKRAMNFHLNELAQCMINVQAVHPGGSL